MAESVHLQTLMSGGDRMNKLATILGLCVCMSVCARGV